MLWLILNLVIFIAVAGAVVYLVIGERRKVEDAHRINLNRVTSERDDKKASVEQLSKAFPGLIAEIDFENTQNRYEEVEGLLNAEKGKVAITDAELDALDIRLRELEELARELEASNLDAIKEVDMLRAQQRDISSQNEAIAKQIESASDQIDILVDMFANNEDAVSQLTQSKQELVEVEKKITFFEAEITRVNEQYIGLKKAYDALDIEYAQLYEKRQSQMEGEGAI